MERSEPGGDWCFLGEAMTGFGRCSQDLKLSNIKQDTGRLLPILAALEAPSIWVKASTVGLHFFLQAICFIFNPSCFKLQSDLVILAHIITVLFDFFMRSVNFLQSSLLYFSVKIPFLCLKASLCILYIISILSNTVWPTLGHWRVDLHSRHSYG